MIKYLIRLPFNRYVITASVIGILGSSACIGALKYSEYSFLNQIHCTMAVEELNKNQVAMELIGEPIKIQPPELVNKIRNKFGEDLTDFWVPFEGSKRRGQLRIQTEREKKDTETSSNQKESQDSWQLKRLEMILQDVPDKLVIIYKSKNDQA